MAVKYVSSIPEYESIDLTKKPTEIEKKFMATQDLSNEINEKKNQESLSTMDKKISKMITNPSVNPELEPIIKSNEETQQIIDETQQRFNDYYMRLNGNITRDDAASILGGWVKKDDYKSRMDAAKQYASTQQKPDMSNLEALQKYIYDRDEARNELDRMNEQRKIDNERLGRGIGEFSAILGDIAKAHGGAPILQRDIDKQLASLNERERNAYRLYTANQQRIDQMKLNDAARKQEQEIAAAARKQEQEIAAAARKQAQDNFEKQFEYQKQKDEKDRELKQNEGEKNRANKLAIANAKAANRNTDNKKYSYLAWNGQYYAYDKELAKTKARDIINKFWDKVPKDMLTNSTGIIIGNNGPVFGTGVKWNETLAVCMDLLSNTNNTWTDDDIKWLTSTLSNGNVYGSESPSSSGTGDGDPTSW